MPDTCLSSEIPQIQQISALPNESLGKSGKWSMYSSEEGKMQMKTNVKSVPFMFQVPNYAWHFNFPKVCFRKIVLNSPPSVFRLPSAPPMASDRSGWALAGVWNAITAIITTALHCWPAGEPGMGFPSSSARCKPCAQPINWWQNSARGAALLWWLAWGSLCTISGKSGCWPLACELFHTRISVLWVHSQEVSSPLEICRRNLQPLKFSLVLNVPTFLGSLEAWVFEVFWPCPLWKIPWLGKWQKLCVFPNLFCWCTLFSFFLFSSKGQQNFLLHKFYWLYSLQLGLWGRCWDSGHCQCRKSEETLLPREWE